VDELGALRRGSSHVPVGALCLVSTIWSLTEQLLFAARWAADLFDADTAVIDWEITGLSGRSLWAEADSGADFFQRYECHEDTLARTVELPAAELRVGWEELAIDWLHELFELFQADISNSTLKSWQTKFLDRRF
jgi:hypothetical protein